MSSGSADLVTVGLTEVRTFDSLTLPAATAGDGELGWLLLPGGSGSFYTQPIRDLIPLLAAMPSRVLALSTRGHDEVWIDQASRRLLGHAHERLAEAPLDVAAGVARLRELGAAQVIIAGHSLGGLKVLIAAASNPELEIDGVVLCSAPRLSRTYFEGTEGAAVFASELAEAEAEIAAGRGELGRFWQFPVRNNLLVPSEYLARYGTDDFDGVALAPRLRAPLLVLQGALESHIMQAGFPDQLVAAAGSLARAQVIVVPDADHLYSGRRDAVVAVLTSWSRQVVLSRPKGRRAEASAG